MHCGRRAGGQAAHHMSSHVIMHNKRERTGVVVMMRDEMASLSLCPNNQEPNAPPLEIIICPATQNLSRVLLSTDISTSL